MFRPWSLAAIVLVLWLPAGARGQIPGLDEWANAVTEGMAATREAPTVAPPAPDPRPDLPVRLESRWSPLAVHADRATSPERVRRVLAALEAARGWLAARGWPEPFPDGGRGGTGGFDLYLVSPGEHPAEARTDTPVAWSDLDAVSSWAAMDPRLSEVDLAACATFAYADATLLGQDPAEAVQWRRATAAWLAWMITGRWGCADAVQQQQREPWRSWISNAAGDGAGGALMLAMLSERHGRGDGSFVRELWQLARQRSPAADSLHATPDLWQAVEAVVESSGETLEEVMEELGIARFFTATPERERTAPTPLLHGLGPNARVPLLDRATWSELPEHTPPMGPPLDPFGSGYVLIDTSEAPPQSLLRLWMRGEYGVEWSFVAIRLGANDQELGRVGAPPRREPRGYVVLELFDDTDRVLAVVTNLSSRLPDADGTDENVRTFKLIASETYPAQGRGGER